MRSREALANWLLCAVVNAVDGRQISFSSDPKGGGGEAYAKGKTLVVFVDAATGAWYPNRVTKALPDPLFFDAVWAISLQRVEDGRYIYGVTFLDISAGNAPTYHVTISENFESWQVEEVQ